MSVPAGGEPAQTAARTSKRGASATHGSTHTRTKIKVNRPVRARTHAAQHTRYKVADKKNETGPSLCTY